MAPVGYLPCHMPAPLTQLLGTRYPIVSAPMGAVAGGRLAAAVSRAGALGMIGTGYQDAAWADFDTAAVWVGEGIDLIRDVAPAGEIVRRLVAETDAALARLRHGDGPSLAGRRLPEIHERSRRGEQLAGLQQGLESRQHHRPAAVELAVGHFAELVVGDGEAA